MSVLGAFLWSPHKRTNRFCCRVMYWIDSGFTPHIDVAAMNGQSRRSLITTNLVQPSAITIDFSEQKLYWSDTSRDKVSLKLV